MKPYQAIISKNRYKQYHLDYLQYKMRRFLKKHNKRDELCLTYRKLKSESGFRFSNDRKSTLIRVINPIDDEQY